jgi:hypothetical protein
MESRKAIPMASYAADANEENRAVRRCLAGSAVSVIYWSGEASNIGERSSQSTSKS